MKGVVVNLSEMVPANEAEKPYNDMILNEDRCLSKPIIKYGVNPATGVPLSDDFMASVVHVVGSVGSSVSDTYDMVAVGERRKLLIDLFFVRADMLFTNMVNALNVQYDKELRYRFHDIYEKLSEQEYSPWGDADNKRIVYLFRPGLFSQENYDMQYNLNNQMIGDGRNRARMSKLVDLEYYMRVPLGTVLDGLLSPIAADYNDSVTNINRILMTTRNLGTMAISYDDFIQFIGICYANLLACAEAVTRLLYDEAMMMIEGGYLNKRGIEYDKFLNLYDSATKEEFAKLITSMITDDSDVITERRR